MAGPGDSTAGSEQVQADQPRRPHPASRGGQGADAQREGGNHGGRGQRGRGGRRGSRSGNNRGRESGSGLQRSGPGDQERNPAPAKAQAPKLSSDATASTGEAVAKDGEPDVEEAEAEICFICASPVVHQSVAPCNHRTCHICALRLRALYKTRACAHCRTESAFVIFTDDPSKRFEDFQEADFQKVDDALGIKYEKPEIHDDTILLLRYNCPDESCDIACYGWPDLHRHVKSVHHKMMCDLCTRNKKVFTHEHELFTQQELKRHEKDGDDSPGALDQSGFKGHPECGFCRRRFYGDDELYVHCREKHERCHICDRQNNARSQQYYVDYNALEAHFRKDHFVCMDQECLDKKFVVFESEMDLKAHQLEVHPNSMSKDVRREARMVNMASFDYRAPHQEDRRGGRSGRGRGRDPNADANPPPSAQPLSRGEIAFQRQMAIQSAQSVSTRTFGGELTSTMQRPTSRPAPATSSTAPSDATGLAAPVNNLNVRSRSPSPGQPAPPSQPLNPREEARRLQHQGVMDRAAAMLNNDPSKLERFRSRVSAYKTSSVSATELIDTFFSLFDVSSGDLGKLIKELADIYESEAKRADLLKAWNDWRAINEDYPSLPGPSGTAQAPSTGSGGKRILRLKSSTAQSNRSAVGRQMGWGGLPSFATNAPASAASLVNPFPSLPPSGFKSRATAVPWASSSAAPTPRPTITPVRRTAARAPPASSDAFPELPKAAKPNTYIFGKHHAAVRWDDGRSSPAANAWGAKAADNAGASAEASAHASETEVDGQDAKGQGSKKKSKKGKEVLYKFG